MEVITISIYFLYASQTKQGFVIRNFRDKEPGRVLLNLNINMTIMPKQFATLWRAFIVPRETIARDELFHAEESGDNEIISGTAVESIARLEQE